MRVDGSPAPRAGARAKPARRGRVALCVLAWLALGSPAPAATRFRFSSLSVEQGLPHPTVRAVLQDRAGFLWFGTEEGLARYDSHGFAVFQHEAGADGTLPDSIVSALLEDREGRLWVGTARGLSVFDRRSERFSLVLPTLGNEVSALLEDPGGALWVGTEGRGLYRRAPGGATFDWFRRDPADPESLTSDSVTCLRRDRSGRLWVGTLAGLDRLDGPGGGFRHFRHDRSDPHSLGHDRVWSLAEDREGKLWVATHGGGLSVFDPRTETFRPPPQEPEERQLSQVFVDRSGTLWVGTDGAGLLRRGPEESDFQALRHDSSDPRSLSHDVVRTVYQDAQDRIWVGTFQGGVSLLETPRHPFVRHGRARGESTLEGPDEAKAFLEDRRGRVWVGGRGGLLYRFDPATGAFTRYSYPPPAFEGLAILCLLEDRQGRLWAGTYRGGLGRFDPESGTFVRHAHRAGDPRSLSDDEVWAIAEDEDGTLWLGTNDGLDRFDAASGAVIERHRAGGPGGLSHARVRTLLVDSRRRLWVGTLGGLNLRRPGERGFVRFLHDEEDPRSLGHGWVMATFEDRLGRLWVGTYGGGLDRLDPEAGTFTGYRRAQGLPSDIVNCILEDDAHEIWMGTQRGLARLDPASGRIEAFDLASGLQSLQFNQGACLKGRDGRLLFGSTDGFYAFEPGAIRPVSWTPPVALTALRLFGEPMSLPESVQTLEQVTLSHADKVFSIEFSALDYSVPRRNHYAYRLDGLGEEWVHLRERREVTFTNLAPGRYVFRARATNSDGVWGQAGPPLRILVTPPVWKTAWFRSLAALGLLAGILLTHRARVRHLERTRRELVLRVDEALRRVRVLRGLIPICAWCKKVRDDKGYWSQVETYIHAHSEADFSHGICPECSARLYPASDDPD